MNSRFVDIADIDPSEHSFPNRCSALHGWVRTRLELCGGWLPDLVESYRPRAFGYYMFDKALSRELNELGTGLARLYDNIGRNILSPDARPLNFNKWRLDKFSPIEKSTLIQHLPATSWATTLRADVVIDKNNHPWIVEVNTDNVGGIEDLIIMTGYFLNSEVDAARRDFLKRSWSTLINTYLAWLDKHFEHFINFIGENNNFPGSIRDATIALVAEDRGSSFALTRVLAALLRSNGLRVICCRPEHLTFFNDTLSAPNELGRGRIPVHVVLKDWLWEEMFDESICTTNCSRKNSFDAILNAVERRKVLILNPITERVLFSKGLLAELTIANSGMFDLDQKDKSYVEKYVLPTELLKAPPKDVGSEQVVKPVSCSGGKGVTIGSTVITRGNTASSSSKGTVKSLWVRQPRIRPEMIRTLYQRDRMDTVIETDLYSVHGIIVYSGPGIRRALAGVMTRIGPEPVVNFGRGAQIVPGILTNFQ
jgi:glutathionylspermidine synthase